MPKLSLSPSIGHRKLMAAAPLRLSFQGGDFDKWQKQLRAKLRTLLAVPANVHASLKTKTLWRKTIELGTIEKVAFCAEPGVDVVAYWCVPHSPIKPKATFICLQGHSTGMHNSIGVDRETESHVIDIPRDNDFALGCMRRGIAALCIEQRSFGQRGESAIATNPAHGACHDAAHHALLLGRTLAGERVFDVERAIDYLASRRDVDMARIGIMGTSGGGSVAMWSAVLLPRIAWCLPVCSTARIIDSIAAMHHCDCNYIPGILNWMDVGDILGAIAPRPLVVVSGKTDAIFPIASAKASYRQARRAYGAADAEKNIRFIEGPEGHRFYADLAWDAMLKMIDKQ